MAWGQNEEENEQSLRKNFKKIDSDLKKNEESGTLAHRDYEAGYGPDPQKYSGLQWKGAISEIRGTTLEKQKTKQKNKNKNKNKTKEKATGFPI